QPALPHARCAARPGDRRRGMQRASRRVGRLRAFGGLVSVPAELLASLTPLVKSYADELVALRRDLHAHPELSWEETRTTGVIHDRLLAAGLKPRVLPNGTGVICDVGTGDRVIALRADIDALPLL